MATTMRLTLPPAVWLLSLLLAGCGGGAEPDGCRGVDCSGHGLCRLDAGSRAYCDCNQGFEPDGLACVSTACTGFDCGSHGRCDGRSGAPVCLCDAGWVGLRCDGCADGYRPVSATCIPETPCDTDPCINGVCRVIGGRAVCDCDDGYAGDRCERCAPGFEPEGLVCVPAADGDVDPDGDTGPDGDSQPDGDASPDGDADQTDQTDQTDPDPADGDTVADGDTPPDGDTVPDGDADQTDQTDQTDSEPSEGDADPDDESGISACPDGYDGPFCTECAAGFVREHGACLPACGGGEAICRLAHRSAGTLPSLNGHGAVGYTLGTRSVDVLLEHPYRNWDEGVETRDMLYDTYFGIVTPTRRHWLNGLNPDLVEYWRESGIIRQRYTIDSLSIDVFTWAPFEVARPALAMAVRAVNHGGQPLQVKLYSLHNYHLGSTDENDRIHPKSDGERIRFENGYLIETGPGGTAVHFPLGPFSHHGMTPDNPYARLNEGQNLADNNDSGTGGDRVAGFQRDLVIEPGRDGWFGTVTVFERFDGPAPVAAELIRVYGDRTAQMVFASAEAAWEGWRGPLPPGLSAAERKVYRQSEAVLRMGQVRETSDLSRGQILASLPPGRWNIAWVRDAAYAAVALVRAGHLAEAADWLTFILEADSGYYRDYVGADYQVSITRYFGRGKEESDSNQDGPNIEFDGFGLFLWALGEYVAAAGDGAALPGTHWETISLRIAAVLAGLIDQTGMIAPDSSIWEVHWNGRQKRYSYTSITAAAGLCHAARLAADRGETTLAASWRTAARTIAEALQQRCIDPGSVLASSLEELAAGSGYHDMATVEAFVWSVIPGNDPIAAATFDSYERHLAVASGMGFFRNDDGGWYDSQEWIFTDLRAASGYRARGWPAEAGRLNAWITAQAVRNFGLIAELHHPASGAYEGEVPMVGFGAGAYLLDLWERAGRDTTVVDGCLGR